MTEYPAIMRITSDNATGDLPFNEQQVWTFDGTVDDDWTFTFDPGDFEWPIYYTVETWKINQNGTYPYLINLNPARKERQDAYRRRRLEEMSKYLIIPEELMNDPALLDVWPYFERKKYEES